MTSARLVLLNGPIAAGKSTVARVLLERYGTDGRCVVLEYDMFADAAGRLVAPRAGPIGARIWKAALPAVIAAARAYLALEFSVLIVMTYERRIKGKLQHLLETERPSFVALLPPWGVSEARCRGRMTDRRAIEELDWEDHRRFYEELVDMARAGEFDEVINTADVAPEQAADRIAERLGLR